MAGNHEEISLNFDEFVGPFAPDRSILQISTDELSASETRMTRKRKKSKKSKRKRARSPSPALPSTSASKKPAHVLSESDDDGPAFRGFKPVYDDNDEQNEAPAATYSAQKLPPWLNSQTPPGPWQMIYPPWMGPYGYANYWQGNQDWAEPEGEDDVTESCDPVFTTQDPKEISSDTGVTEPNEVSILKHLQSLNAEDDTGPPINKDLASLIESLWNKSHREDIKELYGANKRPQNTPSLEKVSLDDDLAAGIPFKARARRTDITLHAVQGAIVKTAISLTRLADRNFSKDEKASKQDTIDTAVTSIKILSHATSLLLQARREQFKSMLDPGLLQQISKNKSLQAANSTHQLFGGELQKQAKEGQLYSETSCYKKFMHAPFA